MLESWKENERARERGTERKREHMRIEHLNFTLSLSGKYYKIKKEMLIVRSVVVLHIFR